MTVTEKDLEQAILEMEGTMTNEQFVVSREIDPDVLELVGNLAVGAFSIYLAETNGSVSQSVGSTAMDSFLMGWMMAEKFSALATERAPETGP